MIQSCAPAFSSALASDPQDQAGRSPLRELTLLLIAGDDSAWHEFHRQYGPSLFRQLLAATKGDHDLASDALQQTYLRIARNVRACESEAMFSAWLRIVARSALSDCRRRRQSFWRMLSRRRDEPEETSALEAGENRLLSALDAALSEMDEKDRVLLQAKYFGTAGVIDIARQLSISPKAVESRLTRARADLRQRLLAALNRHE